MQASTFHRIHNKTSYLAYGAHVSVRGPKLLVYTNHAAILSHSKYTSRHVAQATYHKASGDDCEDQQHAELDCNLSAGHSAGTLRTAVLLGVGAAVSLATAGCFPANAQAAPLAAATTTISPAKPTAIHASIFERINYKTLKVLSLPAYGKFAALLVVGAPLLLGGAFMYSRATNAPWGESLLKTYYVLNSVPGTDITKEEKKPAVFVMNSVHILSIFTFAIIVGVLADDISTSVEAARAGNWRVLESGHTVVLGWDDRRTPLLIEQLLTAHRERGSDHVHLPVVVLVDPATAAKEDVDALLADQLGARFGSVVMTRQGSSRSRADLERVAAGAARTIIVLPTLDVLPGGGTGVSGEEEETAEGHTAATSENGESQVDQSTHLLATLAALQSVNSNNQQNIVVSLDGVSHGWHTLPAGSTLAGMLSKQGSSVASVASMRDLNDMLAHTVLNTGLSAVFEQVAMQGEDNMEFYVRPPGSCAGQSYQQARRSFPAATVCGVISAAEGVILNPRDDYILGEGDQLVLMAPDRRAAGKQIKAGAWDLDELVGMYKKCKSLSHHEPAPHVVVLAPGGAHSSLELLDSLADISKGHVQLSLVARAPASEQQQQAVERSLRASRWKGCKVTWIKEDSASVRGLLAAGVPSARAVVVAPPGPSWKQADTDAQVVASTLHVMESLAKGGDATAARNTPLRLVCGVGDEGTRQVLASLSAARGSSPAAGLLVEPLLVDQLMSGLLGQVAVEPRLEGVFSSLLAQQEGAEFYTRLPTQYGLAIHHDGVPVQALTWGQVAEVVRAQGATAVGIVNERSGDVRLCISSDTRIAFLPGERLVVLADE